MSCALAVPTPPTPASSTSCRCRNRPPVRGGPGEDSPSTTRAACCISRMRLAAGRTPIWTCGGGTLRSSTPTSRTSPGSWASRSTRSSPRRARPATASCTRRSAPGQTAALPTTRAPGRCNTASSASGAPRIQPPTCFAAPRGRCCAWASSRPTTTSAPSPSIPWRRWTGRTTACSTSASATAATATIRAITARACARRSAPSPASTRCRRATAEPTAFRRTIRW